MKKIYLTFIGLITISSSFGQNNKIESTGNVGIGTTTPNQRLHIQSSNSTETYNTFFSGNSIHFDRSGNFSSYLDKTDGGDLVFRFGLPVVDRFYFKNNGNLGIGVNPTKQFQIGSNDNNIAIYNDYLNNVNRMIFESKDSNDGGGFIFRSAKNAGVVDVVSIDRLGKVGIGTTNPDAKLHITDSGLASVTSFQINNRFKFRGDGVLSWGINSDYGLLSWDNNTAIIGAQSGKDLSIRAGGIERVKVKANGDVGIGTDIVPEDYKLAIAGKTIMEEVKVQLQANWPDYVFTNTYILPSLKEVEKHIQEKGHLKDIPSAEEVEKNKGIELGEMNRKLLQKIEELTLYTIQQEKKIKELEKDKERLNRLEEKVNLLLKNK